MRKIKLICRMAIILTILLSCSSNDSSDLNSDLIIGKWRLTAESYGGESIVLTDCEKQQTLQFNSDGTIENYYVDNEPCDFSTIIVDYSKHENNLTISIDGEGIGGGVYVLDAEILILNNSTLKFIFVSDNEEGVFPEDEQVKRII